MDQIEHIFREYGPVESIDLRLGDATSDTDQVYAYVTFRHDKHAYMALIAEKKKSNKIISQICPAFSWKQPPIDTTPNDSSNADAASLLLLNDDCLSHIFQYCDFDDCVSLWQVCRRTQNVLENHVLSKFTNYALKWDENEAFILKKIRTDLKCIGRYLKSLILNEMLLFETDHLELVVRFCAKYVGASIKEIKIHYLPMHWELIQPIVSKVESLTLHQSWDEIHHTLEIPNVKRLIMDSPPLEVGFLAKPWPKLTTLALAVNDVGAIGSLTDVISCLKNNPQLKTLFLNATYQPSVMSSIPTQLHELIIVHPKFENGHELLYLRKNRNLRKLGLIFDGHTYQIFPSPAQKCAIQNLGKFKHLRSIMIGGVPYYVTADLDQIVIDVGRKLPRLEHFYVSGSLEPATMIEFVKNSPHLETFSSDLSHDVTYDLVKTLVDIRKSCFGNAPILNLRFQQYIWHKDKNDDGENKGEGANEDINEEVVPELRKNSILF